jgi:4-hydroxy-tetrahydrodipicolinate synthase
VTRDWSGIHGVVVTPFKDDGGLDLDRFEALLERNIAHGADGLVVAGSTGEFYALDLAEREALLDRAVRLAAGRVPVIAGVSDFRHADIVAMCRAATDAGCAGGMLLPPIYAMPNAAEILAFYRAVAQATPLPLMLYNSPRRAGVELTPDLVGQLCELPTVVAVKDSSAAIVQVTELCCRYKDRLRIFVGYETMIRASLPLGVHGVVAMAHQATGHLVRRYYDACRAGDTATADRLEPALLAVYRCFQQGSYYAAIKEVMSRMGVSAGGPRPPLLPLTADAGRRIEAILAEAGVRELVASLG